MIATSNNSAKIVLLNFKERAAGSMEKDGKTVTWDTAIQIVGINWEDLNGQVRKFTVSPSRVKEISKQLEPVHWGAVIELTLDNRQVTAVNVLADVMASLYAEKTIDL